MIRDHGRNFRSHGLFSTEGFADTPENHLAKPTLSGHQLARKKDTGKMKDFPKEIENSPRNAQSSPTRRVVIFDAQKCIREMLAMVLRQEGNFSVSDQTESGLTALKIAEKQTADLIILDLALVELDGLTVLKQLYSQATRPRILLFTACTNRQTIAEALHFQPDGFVHKSDSLDLLRDAIRAVSAGCRFYTPFAREVLQQFPTDPMSGRQKLSQNEQAVLQMVAEGRSNKQIACRLGLSCRTVEHHRSQMTRKLGLNDVPAITRYAMDRGLISFA